MSCLRSRFFVCLFQKLSVAEITLSSDLAKAASMVLLIIYVFFFAICSVLVVDSLF